jgi:hypothetical protein
VKALANAGSAGMMGTMFYDKGRVIDVRLASWNGWTSNARQ